MFGWFRKLFGGSPHALADTSPGGVYTGLRAQALAVRRDEAGLPAPPADAPVWGVLMETGYPGAVATLLALADGTTSLYLSSGGGVIGGQAHQSVRAATTAFLDTANHLRAELRPAPATPLPEEGQTVFYALTDAGVLTGGGVENDLGEGRHELSELFHAGHGVIAELRVISGG